MNSESTRSIDALRQTVKRLEQRLGAEDGSRTTALMGHYWAVVAQIKVDQPDERDQLLCRVGALMLLQTAAGDAPDQD